MKPLAYIQYIDDILISWADTEQKLIQFHEHKPTEKLSYLMYDSFHHHTKQAIIYRQALHYNLICSDTSEKNWHLGTLRKDFINRLYNPRIVDHNIHRVTKVSKNQLLKYKQKRETDQTKGYILTIFPGPPILAFRLPSNLRRLIITSSLSGSTYKETHPCERKRCKTCPHILSSDRVPIPDTLEEYYVHGHYTCSSSNVFYAISSTKYPTRSIYIGKTGHSLINRTNVYNLTINNKKLDTPEGKNFSSPNYNLDDFKI
ncbi:hypothetical protein XELAEV_18047099mg [Xenopus laevis]|uniref:Reverse transcriptase domain-containing protein n=1 Tax=Xenopus laevis TaxID=8355 RepID=A0A974H1I3_XENLA|nr:hypothetical protein XELAEV_18047099mg [Xenopus laevis]